MSDVVIRAEGLGKKYVIGHRARREGYSTLRDAVARGAHTLLRKAGDMIHGRAIIEGDELEEVWALRDVSFEINRGDVVGVIGRNGAGKSTLLKILSRITEPTTGRVEVKGRVASLLEVGTGFHPELSGRENIFLNGAILGMRRDEISRKFDAIVEFAEVERFLDTPVKRYSSGMYVRLAFAVAAHLEPEILIVDEVLAVGDAMFQDKCLGKMKSVAANNGRTVLFVSHSMAAVSALTQRALLLAEGCVQNAGETHGVVLSYLDSLRSMKGFTPIDSRGQHTKILVVNLLDPTRQRMTRYVSGQELVVSVDLETDGTPGLSIELLLRDPKDSPVGLSTLHQFYGRGLPIRPGRYRYEIVLSGLWLAAGRYSFDVTTSVANIAWDHYVERAVEFEVPYCDPEGRGWDYRFDLGFGPLALRSEEVPRIVQLDAECRSEAARR